MNVQDICIIFLHIYKNVQTEQYKTCTKFRLKTAGKLKYMFFAHTNNVQTIQNLYS